MSLEDTKHYEELRLLPKKRGNIIQRLFFSRLGITILMLLAEIAILVSIYHFFEQYFSWFYTAQWIFIAGMTLYLVNCDMDGTSKLTWMLLISIFPIPASIALWFAKTDTGHRFLAKRLTQLIEESKGMIGQDENVLRNPELVNSGTDDLCTYLNRSGTFPIYDDTEVTFFPLGEYKFEAMLKELEKAEKYIYMEYFIITEGYMWGRILKILADKAAAGVDVRVMYDGMCEMGTLSTDYSERMRKLGIRCRSFTPLRPFLSTLYNYRDHRKILVIDGRVAFNGGVNLADEYINKEVRFGHWKDTAVMLKGSAAQSFTLMFLQMWNILEEKPDWFALENFPVPGSAASVSGSASSFPDAEAVPYAGASVPVSPCSEGETVQQASDRGFVLPYCEDPLDDYRVGEMVYMDILNRAKSYVHIMTPYLILDNPLENALKFAAERGVDVELILPGIPDKKAAYALAKTHYEELLKAGVKIYTYTPGFVHAKIFVSDDVKAVVGTINLDYRSLYHHFECATYLYRCGCIKDIAEDFEATRAKCAEVTPETIKNETLQYRILGMLAKQIAPLM